MPELSPRAERAPAVAGHTDPLPACRNRTWSHRLPTTMQHTRKTRSYLLPYVLYAREIPYQLFSLPMTPGWGGDRGVIRIWAHRFPQMVRSLAVAA